jgi:hypothetical protein
MIPSTFFALTLSVGLSLAQPQHVPIFRAGRQALTRRDHFAVAHRLWARYGVLTTPEVLPRNPQQEVDFRYDVGQSWLVCRSDVLNPTRR